MILIGKRTRLQRQEDSTRIHEIDTGQMIPLGNLLSAGMFEDCHRIIRPPLHRRIIDNHHHLATVHDPNSGDNTGRRGVTVVHVIGRKRTQLKKRRAFVQHLCQALTGKKLASINMALASLLRPPLFDELQTFLEQAMSRAVPDIVLFELRRVGIDLRFNPKHGHSRFFSNADGTRTGISRSACASVFP